MADRKSPGLDAVVTRKIVLYGRPASGKTCFLAALAMPREPHPLGYSCVWVCDGQNVPQPEGDRSSWDPREPVAARYLGKEWLQDVIAILERGDLPEGNRNAPPYHLLFELTQPNGRIQRIETVDYSGELADPNLSEDVLAKQLMKHLEEADAILVLAEAPRPNEKHFELYRELQILQQALVLVSQRRKKGDNKPMPIAMLLNKWDRYTTKTVTDIRTEIVSAAQLASKKSESAQLARYNVLKSEADAFLEQQPPVPQSPLYNVLKAIAGTSENEPCHAAFAVSALGKTRKVTREENGKAFVLEIPEAINPLASYGLEDPLVWAVQQADRLETAKLRARVNDLAPWKTHQLFTGAALTARSDILNAKRRFPENTPEEKSLATLAGSAIKALGKQLAFALVLAMLLPLAGIEWSFWKSDNAAYTKLYPSLEALKAEGDPLPWMDDWKEAANFFGDYAKPAWFRFVSQHAMKTTSEAEAYLALLRPKLENTEFESALRTIEKSASVLTDSNKIQELIEQAKIVKVPDGLTTGIARKEGVLSQLEKQKNYIAAGKFDADLKALEDRAPGMKDPNGVLALIQDIKKLPVPPEYAKGKELQSDAVVRLTDRMNALAKRNFEEALSSAEKRGIASKDPREIALVIKEAEALSVPPLFTAGGDLKSQAIQRLSAHMTKVAQNLFDDALAAAETRGNAAEISSAVEAAIRDLKKLIVPPGYAPGQERQTAVLDSLTKRFEKLAQEERDAQAKDDFDKAVQRFRFGTAADGLENANGVTPSVLEELKARFFKKWQGLELQNHLNLLCENRRWSEALMLVSDLSGGAKSASSLWGNASVAALCASWRQSIAGHQQDIQFEDFKSDPQNAAKRSTVMTTGKDSQKKIATVYDNYLTWQTAAHDWTVVFDKISSDNHGATRPWDTKADLTITVNGVNAWNKEVKLSSRPDSMYLGSDVEVSAALDDKIKINVTYDTTPSWRYPVIKTGYWNDTASNTMGDHYVKIKMNEGYEPVYISFHMKSQSNPFSSYLPPAVKVQPPISLSR